jgi:hypothetical protein
MWRSQSEGISHEASSMSQFLWENPAQQWGQIKSIHFFSEMNFFASSDIPPSGFGVDVYAFS